VTYRFMHPPVTAAVVLFVVLATSTGTWLRSRTRPARPVSR